MYQKTLTIVLLLSISALLVRPCAAQLRAGAVVLRAPAVPVAADSPDPGGNPSLDRKARTQPAPAPREEPVAQAVAITGFVRGDANADGAVDMSDALNILNCKFSGRNCSECQDAADVNDDDSVDVSDALSALNFLFRGSARPPLPYPDCGVDLTPSELGCRVYEVCQASPTTLRSWREPVANVEAFDSLKAFKFLPNLPKFVDPGDIVYMSSGSNYELKIMIMNDDGMGIKQVGVLGSRPAWSPGGWKIAFEGGGDICVVDHDGSNFKKLTVDGSLNSEREPAWSPDGKKIVFNRENDLHVLTLDANGYAASIVKITNATATGARDYEPAWSPDGSRIVFARAQESASDFDLYMVHADGSNLVQVTDTPGQDREPAWSPSGNGIVFSRRKSGGNYDLHFILFAGPFQFPMQITSDSGVSDREPSFSPDGSRIVFMRRAAGATWLHNIFTIKLNATALKQLTFYSWDAPTAFARSPDWRW